MPDDTGGPGINGPSGDQVGRWRSAPLRSDDQVGSPQAMKIAVLDRSHLRPASSRATMLTSGSTATGERLNVAMTESPTQSMIHWMK